MCVHTFLFWFLFVSHQEFEFSLLHRTVEHIGKLGRHSFGNLVKFKSDLVLEWGKPLSTVLYMT